MEQFKETLDRLSQAIRKLTSSASPKFGADCLLHAKLAQAVLATQGMVAEVVVGEAAWRVGLGDGDVITHSPQIGGHAPAGGGVALAFHAWLEVGEYILDFSTHSLRVKAAQLDAADGGVTSVVWCPDYLVMKKAEALTVQEVASAYTAGPSCYRAIPELKAMMEIRGLVSEVAAEDVFHLQMLYKNPSIQLIGPNDIAAAISSDMGARQTLADDAFASYAFGDDVVVVGSDNWCKDDPDDFTKIVYIEGDDAGPDSDSERVSFHVRFTSAGAISEVYALLMRTGGDIGTPTSVLQAACEGMA
jgi:hypothetical protein